MQKTIYVILIAFIAGLSGSYVYDQIRPEQYMQGKNAAVLVDNHRDNTMTTAVHQRTVAESFQSSGTGSISTAPVNTEDFVTASERSRNSVVYIKNITHSAYGSTWLDWFFGQGGVQAIISSGSGVIYSSDGYIITNNHVVNDADRIEVVINKKTYEADIVGTDPSSDLAVLKIDAKGLPAIRLGSSEDLKIGEWVLAVGNPFNLTSTVTAGIVSAKGRDLGIIQNNSFPIESFIQTDAAINPGNSGGALVNLKGELVGINTAILSRTGSYAGYGFAVPSDIVGKIVGDIIQYGEVQKAFIGADVMDIDSEIATRLNLEDLSGVVVSYIQKDGAALKAGLQKGDIILKIDGHPIESHSQFDEILSYHSPGDKIDIIFKRKGKIMNRTVTLTNKEGTTELLRREIYSSRTLGADFEKVSKVERDLLNIDYGVRIVKVHDGLIRQMELEEGFIITNINRIPIKDPETLTDILTKIRGRVQIEGVNKQGIREYYRYYF